MAEPMTDDLPSAPPEYVEYERDFAEAAAVAAEPVEQPEGAIVADPPRTEAERITPDPTAPFQLESGFSVQCVPMKTIETMKLLRIITHGAGGFIGNLMDGLTLDDANQFAQSLATVVIMSIPDATVETLDFVRSMVEPAGIRDVSDKKERQARMDALDLELANPSLEDLVTIVECIIRRESEDIRALGKRLGAALNWAARADQLTKNDQTQKD